MIKTIILVSLELCGLLKFLSKYQLIIPENEQDLKKDKFY